VVTIPTEYRKGFADGWMAAMRETRQHDNKDAYVESHFSTTKGEVRKTARRAYEKPKRKPSAYNKRYASEYRRLKKKHPRLSFAALSKRTHKALRRKK